MTLANKPASGPDNAAEPEQPPVPEGHVRLTIDGIEVIAPKGELVIRAAERLGIAIPRFCDHPLLEPVGACRQCLVEVEMGGKPMPKPQASCTQTVADGMVVKTQLTSPVAEKAQRGNLEFLLLNHPLDCPVCDKGGECPLQNQTMADGSASSRLIDEKRLFEKPIAISTEILLDRERCVLCQRCTRFSDQIAGDKFIDLLERGSGQQIGIGVDAAGEVPFQSYFSGNTIQICPVGALTSADYRFRARPFDLVSSRSVCEHCAGGDAVRTDHRRGEIMRRLAWNDPEVNEEWISDKCRFAFTYVTTDRLTTPLVRRDGVLAPASWTDAVTAAAAGLEKARDARGVGVLAGGRLTASDAYAYAKFARVALRSNDIDFRARYGSDEELAFLAGYLPTLTGPNAVRYADLESAPTVVLVAFEPEEESPTVFLRLRKAVRKNGTAVHAVAPLRSRGLGKLSGTLVKALPGDEAGALDQLPELDETAIVLVGERAAQSPGLLTAVAELARRRGARLAWIPRRAGEVGSALAGAAPTLLPGGRLVADPAAREELEKHWGAPVPDRPGRNGEQIIDALVGGELSGVVVGGVDPGDLPDPAKALAALEAADFVVSLEQRLTAVTDRADVVLPIAAVPEKSGAFVDWEGRVRPFDAALGKTGAMEDGRVLDTIGVEMDVDLYTQSALAAQTELERVWRAIARPAQALPAGRHEGVLAKGAEAVRQLLDKLPGRHRGLTLASWRMLLDGGTLLIGEPHLAGTAKPDVVLLAAGAAAERGIEAGQQVSVTGPAGSLTLPAQILPDTEMLTDVVWLPGRVDGVSTSVRLGATVGAQVHVEPAAQQAQPGGPR
ncbi:NADH-quinone oxidoreductase subunit G [Nakamurella aerolata]|uniref:NADH-quinone oxidoreductase n=1 Tax=Nakamurella aerolata TaxID=1656892 RepID=A0A849A7P0_9ACTN|nr:NADH-quinone oxidoreductase subunit G [Nakamurella aerolata]NNG35071.1 NADH-quinone oxidoreductase subunit G [Nakamurella aerolata]